MSPSLSLEEELFSSHADLSKSGAGVVEVIAEIAAQAQYVSLSHSLSETRTRSPYAHVCKSGGGVVEVMVELAVSCSHYEDIDPQLEPF